MSDSAKGNGSGPGAKANASVPAQAPLEAETADRFASSFVPAWQFDDAPFAAGPPLPDEEIRRLGAQRGVDSKPDVSSFSPEPLAKAVHATDPFPPPRHAGTIRLEPSVVISDDLIEEAAALSAPRAAAAQPTAAAKAPPAPSERNPDDTAVVRTRSSKRVIVGIVAAVATSLGVVGFLLARPEASAEPAPAPLTSSSTRAAKDIPILPAQILPAPAAAPPPAPAAPPEMSKTTVSAMPAPTLPIPLRRTPSPSPPPRPAPAPLPRSWQESARPPRNPPMTPTKPASGGIVRDNPF